MPSDQIQLSGSPDLGKPRKISPIDTDDLRGMFFLVDNSPPEMLRYLERMNTAWRSPNQRELEEFVLNSLHLINSNLGARSTSENQTAFEKGWQENLETALANGIGTQTLKPRYFRESKYLRYDKTIIMPENQNLEYDLFVVARYAIFSKYLTEYQNIYEFGCGACGNLLMLSGLFPEKKLLGLDWAKSSVAIANLMAEKRCLNIEGLEFDMLHPNSELRLRPDSAVVTIHSLEQLGDRFGPFLEFLIAAKPELVVHYEPILEFYDPNNLWDYLAILYSEKRGYLLKFLTALRSFVEQGHIEIIDAWRPYLGGVLHEASVVAWRPL